MYPLHIRGLLTLLCRALLAAFLAGSLLGTEGARRNYDLPESDAEAALKLFSQQSGRGVIAGTDVVRGVRTRSVRGEMTAGEALNLMLAGTGLVGTEDQRSGTFAVKRGEPGPNGAGAAPASGRPIEMARMEVNETRIDGLNNKGLLQGGPDAPLYHDVITRTDIERMGVTSLEELFRLIPQTSSPTNALQDAVDNSQSSGGATTHVSTMGLRGFAAAQTVILINGRSLPRTGTSDSNGADLGRIPLAAIERIEILPYAGSAIYGAGAIGGAINMILRKEYTGKDLTLYAGTATEGGASEYRVNYVDGRTFNHGRGNLTLTFSYQHRDALYGRDRDYLDRALARYGPGSGIVAPSGVPAVEELLIPAFAGAPATIVMNTSASPTQDLGIPGAPGARYATVPAGTTPAGSFALTPASFTSTAGEFPSGNRFGRSVLYEPIDSYTLNAQVEHEFIKDRLSAYGEFTVGYNRKDYTYPQALGLSLGPTDPLNPFRTNVTPGFVGRTITIYLDATDVPDSESHYKYRSARAVLGLKGRLSERWDWSVDGVIDYAHNTIEAVDTTNTLLGLNFLSGRAGAAPAAVRRAVYPILADHTVYPNPASDTDTYFYTERNGGTHGVQKEGNARVTGELLNLPSGPLKTSLVTKYQDWSFTSGQSTFNTNERARLLTGKDFVDTGSNRSNSRNVWQNAAEFSVPVIGRGWRPLPIESLEIQGSVSYETDRTTSTYTSDVSEYRYTKHADSEVIAARLQATPSIAIRGSYSSAFYPPGWSDVSSLRNEEEFTEGFFPDAARGNTIQDEPWTLVDGGNPSLQPERAKSRNLGLILTPRFLPGLTLNVDYWGIEKTDAVTAADFVAAWGNPDLYAFAITRAVPTPEDAAKGWLGVVTMLDTTPVNAAKIKTEGFDFRLRYRMQTDTFGEFTFNANASFTNNFLLTISPGAPTVDLLNGGGAAPLKWRGMGSLNWTEGRWSTTITSRYVGHYSSAYTDPSEAFPAGYPLDGGRIPAYLHWDLQVSYEVPAAAGRGWMHDIVSGTRWTVGVNNAFNDQPAFASGLGGLFGTGTGFYSTYDDPRQRYVYLQVRKSL